MTATQRAARTADADELCGKAFHSVGEPPGCALVAVGGYGRGELAPYSDLDLILLLADDTEPGEFAAEVWYPLWDSGMRVDHSVRSLSHVMIAAADDLRVALGVLDARHIAGDPNLTLRLRTAMLTQWRRDARERVPELRQMVHSRHERVGELAHVSIPELKEAYGGLRDATVLKALVATWLVDVPHRELEEARQGLMDVRDEVHELAGRATDRIAPEVWPDLAARLDLPDGAAAQRHVRELGRRLTHLSRLTWRRVDGLLTAPTRSVGARPGPLLDLIAPGLGVTGGEVVLTADARPSRDPALILRAAAEAAERALALNPAAAARLSRESSPLPQPWPNEARQAFVRLLAAGPGLLPVWETLDETGALGCLIPEWERIRLLPHASEIHRFTVDRHLIETCIEASALIRQVSRPDVLVIAALLHDIGKGGLVEHCVAGEPIAREVATRIGLSEADADRVARLVRHHLLLATLATTRDAEDPAALAELTAKVPDLEDLALLTALTEADARATSAKAWSPWRAGLIRTFASRAVGYALAPHAHTPETWRVEIPPEVVADSAAVAFTVMAATDGSRITAVSGDRVGLLADVAACLALQRSPVRRARAWNQDGYGVSVWDVADEYVDAALLRQRYEALRSGRSEVRERLRPTTAGHILPPTVVAHRRGASDATVLEVRAADQPGVLLQVLDALAGLNLDVVSAHVDTLGPQAVDVFYVREEAAAALGEQRAAHVARTVRKALGG